MATPHEVNRGGAVYCGRRCFSRWQRAVDDALAARKSDVPGCHEWTGSRDKEGYGRLYPPRGEGTGTLAHRYMWELANGPMPPGKHACHHCDNPPCVRLDHLFLGDAQTNMADRNAKGRQASGDRSGPRLHPEIYQAAALRGMAHPNAKLTDDGIREIRRLRSQGSTQKAIAIRLGVSEGLVWNVLTGRNWKHIT